MIINLKELSGTKSQIEIDESKTIEELKGLIGEDIKCIKLVVSGKILNDTDIINDVYKPDKIIIIVRAKLNIKEADSSPTPVPSPVSDNDERQQSELYDRRASEEEEDAPFLVFDPAINGYRELKDDDNMVLQNLETGQELRVVNGQIQPLVEEITAHVNTQEFSEWFQKLQEHPEYLEIAMRIINGEPINITTVDNKDVPPQLVQSRLVNEDYANELVYLETVGFTDKTKNIQLLRENNGNIEIVINLLLEE